MNRTVDCQQVRDLAAEFVLGTLDESTARHVREHLATCPDAHEEVARLGGVLPYLADSLEPVAPRAELRQAVVDAAREARPVARLRDRPAESAGGPLPWLYRVFAPRLPVAAALTGAAAIVLAATSLALFSELERTRTTADVLRRAIAAAAEPGAVVVRLAGSPEAPTASGLAIIAADGGAVVLGGLPPAPPGHYYEAWFLTADVPTSAGRLAVEPDGTGLLGGLPPSGRVDEMAVTLEPIDGGPGPDGPIYASGAVSNGPG